jgi:hypothetical protein
MGIGKFNKPAAGARPPAKKKSRYAGIKAAQPRDPMPHVGEYIFRVLEVAEGHNPGKGTDSHKKTLEIVELDGTDQHAVGDSVVVIDLINGKGGPAGLGRVKAFTMAAAGFEDEEAYDAFDPDGEYIDSTCTEGGPLTGRLVACKVTRGNTVPDSTDYYRVYAWAPVGEEHQDVPAPTVEAAAE